MTVAFRAASVSKFLADVAEQRLGYRFGDALRVTPESLSVVIPIIRDTPLKRQYMLLCEVADEVTITDAGIINRMRLHNRSKHNVFVRSGTIFRGKTQARALTRSAILFPGMVADLDVRCVHRSRGIKGGTRVEADGYTPLDIDKAVYKAGYVPNDQHAYWHSVHNYAVTTRAYHKDQTKQDHTVDQSWRYAAARPQSKAQMTSTKSYHRQPGITWTMGGDRPMLYSAPRDQQPGTFTSYDSIEISGNLFDTQGAAEYISCGHQAAARHDDLASIMDDVSSNLDAILAKVKRVDNQVGLGLVTEKGLQCIEFFDLDESWAAIHGDAVKRVGSDLARVDAENAFEFKPRAALNTLAAVLADDYKVNVIFKHKADGGEPSVRIYGLTSSRFVGEVVEVDNRVMHVSIIRMAA